MMTDAELIQAAPMLDIIFDIALSLVTAYCVLKLVAVIVDWIAATAAQNELDRDQLDGPRDER